ncbi:hypothetical protein F2P81_012139 [Scophthalmus maximus]|uniref:Uncharacterized protein n=1 Tax=Scophthalmus maximus TaxID=52904 RepID=A0A6A4STL8_SCOMX|nr:hypothetical protein F2P81_012139 [Scophthalmus maximus]
MFINSSSRPPEFSRLTGIKRKKSTDYQCQLSFKQKTTVTSRCHSVPLKDDVAVVGYDGYRRNHGILRSNRILASFGKTGHKRPTMWHNPPERVAQVTLSGDGTPPGSIAAPPEGVVIQPNSSDDWWNEETGSALRQKSLVWLFKVNHFLVVSPHGNVFQPDLCRSHREFTAQILEDEFFSPSSDVVDDVNRFADSSFVLQSSLLI